MRERKKKEKAEEKRQRKLERKAAAEAGDSMAPPDGIIEADEVESDDPTSWPEKD